MNMQAYRLYKFACGHLGRGNEAAAPKASAFIRVAEARDARVEKSEKKCPDCGGSR